MNKLAVALTLSIAVLLSACNDSTRDLDQEFQSSIDFTKALKITNDIFLQQHDFARNDTLLNGTNSYIYVADDCLDFYTVTQTNGKYPKTLNVYYPDGNTTPCFNGMIRSGLLRATYSNAYTNYNASVELQFKDFYYNGYLVKGTALLKNRGANSTGFTTFRLTPNFTFTDTASQKSFTLNGQLDYAWTAGSTNIQTTNDEFEVTGSVTGISSAGTNYSAKITSAIPVNYECVWPSSGEVTLEPTSLQTRYLKYGFGTCDNSFTLEVNFDSQTIEVIE